MIRKLGELTGWGKVVRLFRYRTCNGWDKVQLQAVGLAKFTKKLDRVRDKNRIHYGPLRPIL
jgi:hypothetical protein